MQIFKTFFNVSKKYMMSFFIYTGIFLGLTSMMVASQSKSSETTFEASSVDMAIFDHDNSSLSKALSDYLKENNNIIEIDEDINSIKDSLYQREVYYVLIIPNGFEQNVKAGNTDTLDTYKIDSQASVFLDGLINKYVSVFASICNTDLPEKDIINTTNETVSTEVQVDMLSKNSPEFSEVHFFYVFMPYILISVIVMTISQVLIVFNKPVIKKRMLCSCNSNVKMNLMLGLAALVYVALICCAFILYSLVVYSNEMFTDIGAVRIANVIVHSLVSLGFAFLVASLVTKQQFVGMVSNVYGLASSFLCGVFVDRELLGKGVVMFGRLFPASWYVDGESILSNNDSLSSLSNSNSNTLVIGFVVQLLFAGAFFVLGMIAAKYKKKA